MISAALHGDELCIYRNGTLIFNCGFGNIANKQVQVSGLCVRVIGESSPGVPTCIAIEFDENGNYKDYRNEFI